MQRRPTYINTRLSKCQASSWQGGMTMLELLAVLAIAGIVMGIGAINGRQILKNQQESASLRTLQQSIWQGATSASAKGKSVVLRRKGQDLILREKGGKTIRTFELAKDVETNLPSGKVLEFTSPGKVKLSSLKALPNELTMKANDKTYLLTISVIGEVKTEVLE